MNDDYITLTYHTNCDLRFVNLGGGARHSALFLSIQESESPVWILCYRFIELRYTVFVINDLVLYCLN